VPPSTARLAPALHPQAAEPVKVGQVAGDEQHVGIRTRSSGLGDDVRVEQEVDHQGGTRPVNAGSGAGSGGTAGQGCPAHRGRPGFAWGHDTPILRPQTGKANRSRDHSSTKDQQRRGATHACPDGCRRQVPPTHFAYRWRWNRLPPAFAGPDHRDPRAGPGRPSAISRPCPLSAPRYPRTRPASWQLYKQLPNRQTLLANSGS